MGQLAHTPKVLLVDDDPFVRDTAGELLRALGYDVVSAASGDEALDLLSWDRSIDVLFTDVRMPGMDGFTLADFATVLRPELAVLFATAFADALAGARTMPGVTILQKPYRLAQLGPAIGGVLTRAA
ncbi:MAG: sensor hybrid histidine kinase [Rhodospirillales bacterium]|nr:sensor hybrid histidine kinase [Rhodospirillales bacterium]